MIEEYLNGTAYDGRTLDWDDNSDNEDGFIIEVDTGGGYAVLDTVAAGVTTYFHAASVPGDDYRVKAYNAFGESAYSNIDSAECY
jgi:hypothetical protein